MLKEINSAQRFFRKLKSDLRNKDQKASTQIREVNCANKASTETLNHLGTMWKAYGLRASKAWWLRQKWQWDNEIQVSNFQISDYSDSTSDFKSLTKIDTNSGLFDLDCHQERR